MHKLNNRFVKRLAHGRFAHAHAWDFKLMLATLDKEYEKQDQRCF